MQTNRRKILFASVAADGHFNPLTGLAKHLEAVGHDVRWYASKHYAEKIDKLQMVHYPFTRASNSLASNLDADFPERKKIKNPIKKINWDIVNFFVMRGPEYLEDIREIRKTFPFDLMICDNAFTGSVYVKEKLFVPVIAAGILPLPSSSKDLPPYGLGLEPSYSALGKIKQRFLRWLANKVLFKKSNDVMQQLLASHGISHDGLTVFDIGCEKVDLFIQSGTPSFDYKRSDLSRKVRFVGPLLPYSSNYAQKKWHDARLGQYKNIVLITQGTVEKDITKLIEPTLKAFRNHPDTLVICTTGGSMTKLLQKQYSDHNIIIQDFIPFDDVMPYVDVYVSNGGYGGVLLGIKHKIPMVVAGLHEGKNEICTRVGYFKYGINLKTEKPSPGQIRKAVDEVLANKIYRENITRLAKEMQGFDTFKLVEGYIEQLLTKKSGFAVAEPLKNTYQLQ